MKRLLTATALGLGLVLTFATAAHADNTPGYVEPPFSCGPTQAPSQVPCDQIPTVPTTAPLFRYCLGYPQQFPYGDPCPKPPVDNCSVHPEEYACSDPGRTAPVERVPGGTVVPTTTAPPVATTGPPASVEVSSTVVVHQTQHRATQRRSGQAATTTTTLPPLFFVLGQWLTYDEFMACIDVMGA